MNKEIGELQQQFGVPDSAPYNNANATRSRETQLASSANRPHYSRDNTTGLAVARNLPPLKRKETRLAQKKAHPWQHLGITLGLLMIVLFDIVVPCIIYYTWYDRHKSTWEAECRDRFLSRET